MKGVNNWEKGFFWTMSFWLWSIAAAAQVLPPNFICIKNDTLLWEIPNNTCGAFSSYDIFASQNPAGPYSLLAAITNQGQTSFFHSNAGSGTWHYYLQSNFNCPGQVALSSDTLDNRIPEPPRLSSVSVNADKDIELSWSPSASPEVFAYIISKNTPSGTRIIDTVFGGTNFVDTTALPDVQQEAYFVVAIDPCGNTSLVTPPHSNILMQAEGASACDRSVKISWTLYQNWANGVEKHEIWVQENGTPARLVGQAASNATAFTFENANAGVEYCFFVKAIENGTGFASNSNQVCLTLDVVQGVTELVATSATITADNKVQLSWIWNANAEISKYEILRATGTGNFTVIATQAPDSPLSMENIFIDETAAPSTSTASYQIRTVDACNTSVISNTASTVLLQAKGQGNTASFVFWTDYSHNFATTIRYELYRIETNTLPTLIASYGENTREHLDELNPSDPSQLNACYFVIASTSLALPNGTVIPVESRSNTACAAQSFELFVPNAFVPNGLNQTFRPVLQFGLSPAAFSMIIYDRWGGKVFETTAIETGWDGKKNGQDLPQGAYTYHIKLTRSNGKPVAQAGTVLLIR